VVELLTNLLVVVVLVKYDDVFVVVVVVLVTILELWVYQKCVLLCPDQPYTIITERSWFLSIIYLS
jgi:hypothetical protein